MDTTLKILVVDASRASRNVISRILVSEIGADNVAVTTVDCAADALAALDGERHDLITCASLLPDMRGIDLCKAVRRQPANRFTPFVLITGEPRERLMQEGYQAGVTDYYDKTRGFEDFVDFMRGFTQRYASLRGKVLYLEDSAVEAKAVRTIMERLGLDVVHATRAEDGLALLDDSFDLVVADFVLQDVMSGGDFLHIVRCRMRRTREALPVLVMTGEQREDMQAQLFHAGANDFIAKPLVEEVFVSRLRALLLVRRQHLELQRLTQEVRRIATTDHLTGLYNKRYLLERAEAILADDKHYPVWIAVLDLDHFKEINDGYGHLIGDQVLEAVGRLLRRHIGDEDIAARIGGEEFVLLLSRRTRVECIVEMEQLRAHIESLRPADFTITASIGLSTNLERRERTFTDLLDEADQAMYAAKQRGRNRVIY